MYISVIIPLYNKEKYIERAINSVLKQSYKYYEIIVINDGSTDRSMNIVNNIIDKRIRLISQSNSGESSARNKGIEKSYYNWVAFLDADDEWHPSFLEKIVFLMSKYPRSYIYSLSTKVINSTGVIKNEYSLNDNFIEGYIDDLFAASLKSPILASSSIVMNKRVFYNIGLFEPGMVIGADRDMWIRIGLNYTIVFSKDELSIKHNEAEDRVSSNYNYDENMTLIFKYGKLKIQTALDENAFKYYLTINAYGRARGFIINGKRKQALNILSMIKEINGVNLNYLTHLFYLTIPNVVWRIFLLKN